MSCDNLLFEKRLNDALHVAMGGRCAIVIVPPTYPKTQALNLLVAAVPRESTHLIRMPGNELHLEGTRGSVRVYDCDHVEYDRRLKHMRGYPASIPTFLHPDLEEL